LNERDEQEKEESRDKNSGRSIQARNLPEEHDKTRLVEEKTQLA